MKKRKRPRTDPNNQVHSEFETTIGNSFNTVRKETPIKNKNEADEDDPLNEVPGDEYDLVNEGDIASEPPKKSHSRRKVDKMPLLIGILGIIGLIGVIAVVRAMSAQTDQKLPC
ncbi:MULTISPECIES: hypothetical protein [Niastella]|uniref:Uncharacterized protein n=1 Tax=Niastella soli TaxID=2821487 RepID=A0ABS3Z1A2_9BACT|nr:hypothetical protein [Niastella soli]MBO9203954.1 hypothetical protein [Niastella soli]